MGQPSVGCPRWGGGGSAGCGGGGGDEGVPPGELLDPHPFAVCGRLFQVEVPDPLVNEVVSFVLCLRSVWSCLT